MFKFRKKYSNYINATSQKEEELIINNEKSISIGTDGKQQYWLTPSQISYHSLILGDPRKLFEKRLISQYMKRKSNIYLFSDNIDSTVEMISKIPESNQYNTRILDIYSNNENNFNSFNIFNKFFSISEFLNLVGIDLLSDSVDGLIREKFMKVFYSFSDEAANLKSYYSKISDILAIFDSQYYEPRHQTFSSSKKYLDELNLIWNEFYKMNFYEYISQILSPYSKIFKKEGDATLHKFKTEDLNNILIISMPKRQHDFAKRILLNLFSRETTNSLALSSHDMNNLNKPKQLNNNVVVFCNTPLNSMGVYNSLWRALGYSVFYSYTDIETLINNNINKDHYYSLKANISNLFLYEIPSTDLYNTKEHPKIYKNLKDYEFLFLINGLNHISFNKILT